MRSLRRFVTRLFNSAARRAEDDRMREEIEAHLDLLTAENVRAGLPLEEARRQALIKFGGVEATQQDYRSERRLLLLEHLVQDVRFGLRMLRKSPAFTAAAVATLALAISANAVVFGIMEALVLRPLDVPEAETLWSTQYGVDTGFQSYPNYVDLRDRNRTFEDLAAFTFAFVGLDTGSDPTMAAGYATTGNYFDVLRVQPLLGRFFHASDEHGAGSAPYVVLSHAYWHRRFQDDPGVIGRKVQINKHPFTIIGVAPPNFRGTVLFVSPDFFMPLVNQEQVDAEYRLNARGTTGGLFEVLGHLRPGVTREQAVADLGAVGAYLERTYPREFSQKAFSLARPGLTSFRGAVGAFMAGLMLLAALILLAACANLGSLFGARAADRAREVALRLALGSSRARILQQLLTEAVLISMAGGTAGLLGSIVLLHRLSLWQPFPRAPIHLPVSPDAKTYIAALVLALVSGLLFGLVPVRQVLRANPYEVVKGGSAGRLGRRVTLRDALLASQIAICAVLVTSSLVAVRGLVRSLHGSFGFEPGKAMLVSTNLAMAGYRSDEVLPMQSRMLAAMEAIPGVEGAGLVNSYPPLVYGAGSRVSVFKEEAEDLRPANAASRPYGYDVSPGYFRAAGTALLAGRTFSAHDDAQAPAVAVVNRALAGQMFGSVAAALSRHCRLQDGTRIEVVGVVEDGKYLSLTEETQPALFRSSLQSPSSKSWLVVRSARDPQELAAAVRSELRDLDAGLPADIDTWSNLLDVVLFPSRVATLSLGVLGLMGAMLSITGVFGMAAYSVSQRLRELGIRLALGAQRWQVLSAALGRAVKLLALGSAAGLLLGVMASR
ncbi:MAG TPA: ADOP family duplicated permease, partial [Vicinamibacteria bacterium]|nr:ADOP family duplicated permease [Vicinamibacteria bacterium]